MSEKKFQIALSSLDTSRFGIPVARAANVTRSSLARLLSYCRRRRIELCMAQCASEDAGTIHALEAAGFRLMDTLITFGRDVNSGMRPPIPADGVRIRAIKPGEEQAVRRVAHQAFNNYQNHYTRDPRLSKTKCAAIYSDWAYREARNRNPRHAVRVAHQAGRIIGFLTLERRTQRDAMGILFAVEPRMQGRQIGQALMVDALAWCAEKGVRSMRIPTQMTNPLSQKIWIKAGFVPLYSIHTFHKWFTPK